HHYAELNEAFAAYFPKDPPARAVLGVARLPESPVEISAVAVRNLQGKQSVTPRNLTPNKAFSFGMLTHDRLFVSTIPGADPRNGAVPEAPAAQVNPALARRQAVLAAAGRTMAHMPRLSRY